jgi:hypothetical protein
MGSVLFSEESPSIRLRDKELGQYKSLEVEIRRQILPRNATLIILLPDLKELIRLERVRPICTYRDETHTENQPRKQPDTSLLAFEYQFRDDLVPLSQKMSQKVAGAAVRESGSGAIPK